MTETKGLRTTFNSPVDASYILPVANLLVENLQAEGAIVIDKSNTPEFGAGASTFSMKFSASPAIHETHANPLPAHRAVPALRLPRAKSGWQPAVTSVADCAH